mmetsp:Transcript_13069/g.39330  ORF Transcript_13069/g.39330 Transcript_13069/m.39330 type:complete len:208 (+) Transcript_13069:2270-2893(+)
MNSGRRVCVTGSVIPATIREGCDSRNSKPSCSPSQNMACVCSRVRPMKSCSTSSPSSLSSSEISFTRRTEDGCAENDRYKISILPTSFDVRFSSALARNSDTGPRLSVSRQQSNSAEYSQTSTVNAGSAMMSRFVMQKLKRDVSMSAAWTLAGPLSRTRKSVTALHKKARSLSGSGFESTAASPPSPIFVPQWEQNDICGCIAEAQT